jgi:hypothetical protein
VLENSKPNSGHFGHLYILRRGEIFLRRLCFNDLESKQMTAIRMERKKKFPGIATIKTKNIKLKKKGTPLICRVKKAKR